MEHKACRKCEEILELQFFYKTSAGNYYSYCKKCQVLDNKERRIKYGRINYPPRNKYLSAIKSRYMGIKHRCGKRKHYFDVQCRLSQEQFIEHYYNEDFTNLYDTWERSGKKTRLRPSIDRIDSKGHYEIGNLRWVTLSENSKLGQLNRTNYNSPTGGRAVEMYNLNGRYLKTFPNAYQASVYMKAKNKGYNISQVCKGVLKTAYGHKWKYVDKTI